MFQFTRGTLLDLTDATRADKWLSPINEAMTLFGIDTKQRASYFLAQVLVESAKLQRLEEDLYYISPELLVKTFPSHISPQSATSYIKNPEKLADVVYGNRMGNTEPGDGWKYRGRGLFQLTGRDNYAEATLELDHDFLEAPDDLIQPQWAARSAAWYWQKHGLNKFADKYDVQGLTKAINGGENGLVQRVAMTAAVMRLC